MQQCPCQTSCTQAFHCCSKERHDLDQQSLFWIFYTWDSRFFSEVLLVQAWQHQLLTFCTLVCCLLQEASLELAWPCLHLDWLAVACPCQLWTLQPLVHLRSCKVLRAQVQLHQCQTFCTWACHCCCVAVPTRALQFQCLILCTWDYCCCCTAVLAQAWQPCLTVGRGGLRTVLRCAEAIFSNGC